MLSPFTPLSRDLRQPRDLHSVSQSRRRQRRSPPESSPSTPKANLSLLLSREIDARPRSR